MINPFLVTDITEKYIFCGEERTAVNPDDLRRIYDKTKNLHLAAEVLEAELRPIYNGVMGKLEFHRESAEKFEKEYEETRAYMAYHRAENERKLIEICAAKAEGVHDVLSQFVRLSAKYFELTEKAVRVAMLKGWEICRQSK